MFLSQRKFANRKFCSANPVTGFCMIVVLVVKELRMSGIFGKKELFAISGEKLPAISGDKIFCNLW